MERIAQPENLRLAYWKASRGKRHKSAVRRYALRLEHHLEELRQQLLAADIRLGPYHTFTIFDPKERTICSAPFPERVLHHALMNVCHERFERYQVYDSYASRPGKGQYAAIERAETFARRHRYFLKLDVRRYFYTIDHEVLRAQLERLFKDERLLSIFSTIIDSHHDAPGRGLPIGSLSSQYFANHYLAVADHHIKERLRAPAYVRYMDDMVLWGDDMPQLLSQERAVRCFCEESLHLRLKPPVINRSANGLPFLGYVLRPGGRHLTQASRRRFARRLVGYAQRLWAGEWSEADFRRHSLPLFAFAEHADTLALRRKILAGIPLEEGC